MFNSKSLNTLLRNYFLTVSICVTLICIFFIPFISNKTLTTTPVSNTTTQQSINQTITSDEMYWPLPGYTRISSPFGYRGAPTAGASSFHGGIDIPAPAGTNIISAISGKVTRTGFMGSGGYSVVIQNDNYTIIFHHISPNYLVQVGDYVTQGQVIAQVGPKNVYGVPNNPYRDSNR